MMFYDVLCIEYVPNMFIKFACLRGPFLEELLQMGRELKVHYVVSQNLVFSEQGANIKLS